MFRVAIVDDEPWVLLGLEKGIPWEELGFEITCKTTDSEEALASILETRPDVIITDIQMPNLSGIDLMRCAREQGVNSQIIVFSGYSDFGYAKKAIQYGVFAYLMKPLSKTEFIKTLTVLSKNLSAIKAQRETSGESLWYEDEFLNMSEFVTGESYCVLTCYMTLSDKLSLDDLLHDISCAGYKYGSDKYVYLLKGRQKEILERLEKIFLDVRRQEKEYICCGLSESFFEKEQLPSAVQESNIAVHNFFLDQTKTLSVSTPTNIKCCTAYYDEFSSKLDTNSFALAKELIEGLPEYIQKHDLNVLDFSYLYNRILDCLERAINRVKETDVEYVSYDRLIEQYPGGLIDAVSFLSRLLAELDTPAAQVSAGSYETFEKLITYIDENYYKDLSLPELSQCFFLNMTYICDLFKKQRSTTFSKYLTSIRLEKAYSSILKPNASLAEIAESVGYRDYYYFIKQFKKKYGVTPGQLHKEAAKNRVEVR